MKSTSISAGIGAAITAAVLLSTLQILPRVSHAADGAGQEQHKIVAIPVSGDMGAGLQSALNEQGAQGWRFRQVVSLDRPYAILIK
jgi:hypothetical protein